MLFLRIGSPEALGSHDAPWDPMGTAMGSMGSHEALGSREAQGPRIWGGILVGVACFL